MTIGGGAGYYLTSGFLPTYLKLVSGIPNASASVILIASSLLVIFACILVGHLSTLWGRKTVFLIMGVLRIVGFPLCLLNMAGTQNIGTLTAYALTLTFLGKTLTCRRAREGRQNAGDEHVLGRSAGDFARSSEGGCVLLPPKDL
ncbi:MAG: hypothetical protein ACLPX7_24250 [Xanthobacteraceae bacterium]